MSKRAALLWTPAADKIILVGRANGHTASDLALALSFTIRPGTSRNAVIGRWSRLLELDGWRLDQERKRKRWATDAKYRARHRERYKSPTTGQEPTREGLIP